MIAYAMLRYQAFAYRGQYLNVLLLFFVSATITQLYALVVGRGGLDGIRWALVWGGVLITTVLVTVDSPLRRGFSRLFLRPAYDYEVIEKFSRNLAEASSLTALQQTSVQTLCRDMALTWVGVWSDELTPETLYLAQSQAAVQKIALAQHPPTEALLPSPPVESILLEEGGRSLGRMWFGPHETAEPFDENDRKLARLLAQELARAMVVRARITDLEATPARILEAVDQERSRIGRDIHDGVLQFLGSIPLSLDRAQQLWPRDEPRAAEVLDTIIEQAQAVSDDARVLVYDLSLPGVQGGRLVELAASHARAVCQAADVTLDWQVNDAHLWQQVRGERAVHVYRILQESLHNAIRHGKPSHIIVRMYAKDDVYVVEIVNDGVRFEADMEEAGGRLGIISMNGRARALGGSLQITPLARGAVVHLEFPR